MHQVLPLDLWPFINQKDFFFFLYWNKFFFFFGIERYFCSSMGSHITVPLNSTKKTSWEPRLKVSIIAHNISYGLIGGYFFWRKRIKTGFLSHFLRWYDSKILDALAGQPKEWQRLQLKWGSIWYGFWTKL